MSSREPTELAEIEALASFLDARSQAGNAPPMSGSTHLPDDLVATARAIDAASQPRGLSARFTQRLEENLMDLAALDHPHAAVPDHRPIPRLASSPTPRRFPRRDASPPAVVSGRRRGMGSFVGFAALIGLIAAIFAQTIGPGGNFAFWQDATPAPPPSDPASGLSRVDAGRTGSYGDAGPAGVPTLRWIAENESAPAAFLQPTVVDGALYVADYFQGDISKVTADGSIVGSVTRPTVIAYLVDGATVFIASGEGESATLGAYGDGDGTELWSVLAGQSAADLGYDGQRIFLVDMDGILRAFSADDGTETWTFDLGVESQDTIFQPPSHVLNDATPAVADDLVVVGTGAGDVRAFAAEDGALRWTFDTPGDVVGSPTILDGTVYVATRESIQSSAPGTGRIYALELSTGEEEWGHDQLAWTEVDLQDPGVRTVDVLVLTTDGAQVYVNGDGPAGDMVTALNAETGAVAWSVSFGVAAGAAPVIAGDTLHLTRPDGGVYGLNAETGEQRWRLDAGTADLQSPVIVDDLLLITTSEGSVIGLGGPDEAATAASPEAGGVASDDISGRTPCVATRLQPDPLPTGEPGTTLAFVERADDQGQGSAIRADVPTEPVADAEAAAGIAATLSAMRDCDRPDKERELGGFYTDDYYRRLALYYPDVKILTLPWVARVPHSLSAPAYYEIGAPVLLADGRVALPTWREETRDGQLVVFVERDGAWLIDEVIRVTEDRNQPMG